MSNLKMLSSVYGLAFASLMAQENDVFDTERTSRKFDEEKVSGKPKDAPMPKGMKRFVIDGKIIYALNEKNAIRKAKKTP